MTQKPNEQDPMAGEIDDLLEGYLGKDPDAPAEDEPVEAEPVEAEAAEPEKEEPPVEESKPEEAEPEKEIETAVSEDKPEDPEPAGEVEPSELDELRKQNELLQQRLNEAYTQQAAPPKQETPPEEKKPDFFGKWQYEDIIDNEASFKQFLGEFAEKVKGYTEESLSKRLPSQVSRISSEQYELQKKVDQFYEEHTALDRVRPYVAQITGQVARENPSWEIDQVLTETAKRSYEALGLNKEPKKSPAPPAKKPAFASTKKAGSRGKDPEPDLTEEQEQILELIDL